MRTASLPHLCTCSSVGNSLKVIIGLGGGVAGAVNLVGGLYEMGGRGWGPKEVEVHG